MGFVETIERGGVVLAEGSVIERIRRGAAAELDPHVANAALVRRPDGRAVLENIYRGYLDAACDFEIPMIMLSPTWRANPDRVAKGGFGDAERMNAECVEFVFGLRDIYTGVKEPIYIGGLLGCKNDSYRPAEALGEIEAEAFHQTQVRALSRAGVDFLLVSTLPARSEAAGIARAAAATGIPYVISFVVRPDGKLLDGSPLDRTIENIDSTVSPPPFFYMINCVHPLVCRQALLSHGPSANTARDRVRGLQANTSMKPPEELDGRGSLDSEDPGLFGDAMVEVHRSLNLQVLGGCCGTDERHIRAIAERLRRDRKRA